MPHVFLVWTTAGDRAHLMWHFLCDGINTYCICLWWASLCFSLRYACITSFDGRGPALLTSVYVILPSLLDFLASVGVLVCSDTFRYLFFFFFSWLQASDFSRDGNKFAILFGSSSKLLLIFRFSFSCVSYAATVFALAAGITISKKGTQRSSGNKIHSFTLLILGERVRGIERADGWRGFDRVMCFIWF